ncbi:hypothetical protein J22TS3_22570 [Paenibacillus sp. J22TS3]|nr:hypothetical protein J22TS3_22570 [Paenibacillus sp. J22TS3]
MFPVSGLRKDTFAAGISMDGYGAFKLEWLLVNGENRVCLLLWFWGDEGFHAFLVKRFKF